MFFCGWVKDRLFLGSVLHFSLCATNVWLKMCCLTSSSIFGLEFLCTQFPIFLPYISFFVVVMYIHSGAGRPGSSGEEFAQPGCPGLRGAEPRPGSDTAREGSGHVWGCRVLAPAHTHHGQGYAGPEGLGCAHQGLKQQLFACRPSCKAGPHQHHHLKSCLET